MKRLIFITICIAVTLLSTSVLSRTIPLENLPTLISNKDTTANEVLASSDFQTDLYEESQDFSNEIFWHKISLPKPEILEGKRSWQLNLSYYVIEELDFYLYHGDQLHQHWSRGALQNWTKESGTYSGIWIPITLSLNENTTLLVRKAGNSPLLTPFKIFDAQEAEKQKKQKVFFWAFIISSLLMLFTHNLFVYVLLKQPGFLYYLSLNAILFIALAIITGFNRWIFPEDVSQWIMRNLFTVFGVGTWVIYRFSINFLKETKTPAPNSVFNKYGDIIFIVFLILSQTIIVKYHALAFALLEVFILITCTSWGISAYLKGFLVARFYLFSWVSLMVGCILNTMIYWKLLPVNIVTESILPISCLIQLLGLSFAVADKSNYFEKERKAANLTDKATDLPNRSYFFDELPIEIKKVQAFHPQLALIVINITSHMSFSKAFGPVKADSTLSNMINLVHGKVRKMDGVFPMKTLNGDTKYIIRMSPTIIGVLSTKPHELDRQVLQIEEIINKYNDIDNSLFCHEYKIGSALYPSQADTLDALYQNALIANNSDDSPDSNWTSYDEEIKSSHIYHISLITYLTDDIKNNKLHFEVQPQVDLEENKICGAEVLIRWKSELLGKIPPSSFIPLAEQTGLIHLLTKMIFEKVFTWVSESPQLTTQNLSLNISALDLLQENFATQIESLIKQYNLSASQFTIEVTETSSFENSPMVQNNISKLHDIGFKLSIDDFGVGFSSMQNIISLDADELKIDQSFVKNLSHDKQSQILCQNIINFSKQLNITNVAEGIESEDELNLLKKWNCKIGQGYFLYRPMSPNAYLTLIEEQNQPLSE
ncbi:EAL domain-containing protein [Marinomonas sp. C2222]|uniref:EAL domain-containing protein n=1 Tax=Marinomonas sargassi TaxID=2984494 RepID=A0ABT2YSF0_9GAMM|nr:EAL domain-containing protein [Marinomonas sargassi]MCV2402818.1 EAL domain-containing protein [Marinomonas sargassi]